MDFHPTIEEGDDHERKESDSDDEIAKPFANDRKKSAMFADDFEFVENDVDDEDHSWIDDTLELSARGNKPQSVTLSAKIARAREMRRLKIEEQKELKGSTKARKSKAHSTGDDTSGDSDSGEGEGSDGSDDSVASDVGDSMEEREIIEMTSEGYLQDKIVETKSQKKKSEAFFESPPVQQGNISFTDMYLSRPLLKAVTSLGYATPTPIQVNTIPVALMGRDICACAATGTGKTAAFMLPILERLLFRPTHTRLTRILILTPTRELAIQIHSVGRALAKNTDIEVCVAAGGLDRKSQEASLRNNPDIVVATPGRLVDHLHNTPSFSLATVEVLVLDEADRMLDEHFEDQMNELIKLCPKSRQTMLFSATMTDQVEELVRLSLNRPVKVFVNSNTDVASGLQQEFVRIKAKREADREAVVTALCSRTFKQRCLVFLHTKKTAHRMRIVFGLLGLKANELHGNLTQMQRLEALQQFKEGDIDYLLATDLAARGLDIESVSTVINYGMPATVKQYIHRVGRTARAGRSGRSVTLVGEKERKVLKELVKQAKCPVKSRIIPTEVVLKFRDKIRRLEPEIKDILKQEEEERQMRLSEMEASRACNLIEHEKEIFSRPARTWIQTSSKSAPGGSKRPGLSKSSDAPKSKKSKREKFKKPESTEEKAAQSARMTQEYAARVAKRTRKKKRIRLR